MNKKLIASLLTVSIILGTGAHVPVKLMASPVPEAPQSMMMSKDDEALLENGGIVASVFTGINESQYADYEEIFKVTGIKSYQNNGGQYGKSALSYAFDGDVKTHWETGRANSDQFKNEVVVTFDEIEEINRIIYAPRPGNKGHVKQMSIYASLTEEGEDFELVASGQTEIRGSLSEFRFKNTEFKQLKFVFDEAHQDWAAAGEFMFFKEDQVADKIGRLFTDATMSQVSEEFNTVDKIKALETEAKSHPFYESYKEDLINAIELIEQEEIITTDAKISKFELFDTPYIDAYDERFRVGSERIESITNNGGQYPGTTLNYAIDEDVKTHWETGKPNSDTFKNEVTITLDSAEVLNRIVYKSRQGGKGFAKNFSIYASSTTKGDNFSKITTGECAVTNDLVEIQFSPTKVKRLKFVFDNAQADWASIGDFRLYKEDKAQDKMDALFTNGLMNEVSEAFNTIEKLKVLEDEVKGHPLEETFKRDLQIAKDIVQGKLETTKVVVAEQHGDMASHASKNLKFGFGNNNQPTGVLAKPGETITVYVDADPNQPLPKLFFSQQEGSFASWGRTVSLQVGENVITVPEVPVDSWYKHDVTKGGPIYIVNPYTKEEQSKTPVIRFVGGERFPFLTADTDVEEFKQFLIEYKERIDADIEANPDVLDRKVIDTFEFVSDHIVWTGTATGAYEAYIERGYEPLETIESYNTHMKEIFRYYGLDGSSINHDPKQIRENVRLAQPYGYMYAAGSHTGVQRDVMANLLAPFTTASWGLTHEIGHRMDVSVRTIGEVTNNMLPMYMSVFYDAIDNRIPFESSVYKQVISENPISYWDRGLTEKLAAFWQLELYKPGYWGEVNKFYRERAVDLGKEDRDTQMLQYLIRFSSEVLGEDLTEYFARHGFNITEETKQEVSKYPKSNNKMWYLNNNKATYKGNGFNEPTRVEVNLSQDTKGTKLAFDINEEVEADLLGYEIVKDGKVIGFTTTNTFVDTSAEANQNAKYEVVPYDYNLGTGESGIVHTFSPQIESTRYHVTVGLNSTFNPLDYAKAVSYKGEDLSSSLKIEHNVDTSKQGIYEVKYTIEDQGLAKEIVLPVEVVSSFTQASDLEWVSATTDWKTVNKDMANSSTEKIKLQVHGKPVVFDKGIGTCGNSEVVYNLEGKGMTSFSAHIGLDSNYAVAKASVVFKVIADGEEIYSSDVIKAGSNAQFINLPIEGVKELKLVTTDSGDGITGDYASWGDAKFTTNSSMPTLKAEDRAVKLGESIDFMEGVTATDVEDGELTSKVEIVSNNYEKGKLGKFEVIYSVTDKDGHKVEKKAYITVYEDFIVSKSKYGQFDNLAEYNKQFKLPISGISNNAGNYPGSPIERATDENVSTHWETNKPNSNTFKNEVTFDLGMSTNIDKMTYAARRGGKGFATKFEVYISSEAESDDFILAGKGEYTGNGNDVIQFDLERSNVRRVKFVFIEAHQDWASIGEVAFYKADTVADKVTKELFADEDKTQVTESYNTLEKLAVLREEVKNHPAAQLLEVDLNKAEEIIEKTFPTLNVEEITYVPLNSVFDLMEGVTANDQEDGDMRAQVEVTSNDFTTNKTGTYNLTYTVIDRDGNTTTKERTIVIYSEVTYLSDRDWASARTDYGSVRKDLASLNTLIRLGVEGETKTFEKGIGTHANSEIVYDLSDLSGPVFFETYVGVDRNIVEQNNSSIVFKILGDGEELYNSGLMKWHTDAKHVKLDLTGVNELELIVNNGGNGNTSDHASFGDAKFLVLDAEPSLEIPKDHAVKVGEYLEDIYGNYTATDAEDGDLTGQVEVSGTVDFNQPGNYTITYEVVDSDDNETIKTRNIAVVDMDDFTYVSDYDWASASCGWGSIRKDRSPSDNIIRLTDENGQEVQFEKGLGTHARSVIKYDLTDKEAEYFSAYVGVDRAMYGTVASVAFEVWLDGEKVAETDVIRSRDAMAYLEVNIAGAKELMIVATDGGNGNGSDHAVWGDAKFHYANENNVKVDTEELMQLIEELSQLNEADYTMQSWEKLVAVQEEALALLEGSMTQEQVDLMVEKLTEAKENLVKQGNNTELEALIARANELEIHLYTAESTKVLQAKLKVAEDILNVEEALQEAIDLAKEELKVAISGLELSKGKAELYKLLQVANQMEESNYTEEADWERFAEWTDYYNELYLDVTIHDEDMYEMVIEGYTAMIAEIESHRINAPEINVGNTVELEQLIVRANELEIHLYTAKSTKVLQAKLKAAEDILNVEDASQEAIDLAKEELEVAISGLELSKGKAELYKLLQIANQMEESHYSEEADWERFAEWTDYYNELYLDVTIHDEDMYELVIEYFSGLIQDTESYRIIDVKVENPKIEKPEVEQPKMELLKQILRSKL